MRKSVLLALSLLGVFISSYLWWVYTSPSRPLFCLGTGCDVVRASSYATLGGLPLPVYGVAMYAALVLLLFAEAMAGERLARLICYLIAGIAGTGSLFSLYLTGLEGFVIHAWCAWCVASAVTITLILLLAVLELIRSAARPSTQLEEAPGKSAQRPAAQRHATVLLLSLAVGIPAFYYLMRHGEMPAVVQAAPEVMRERLVRPDSHITGNPNAPVTVVEFADFQCPACGRQAPIVQDMLRQYGKKIRFVFRQFPLERIHKHAMRAAEASECASAQGKFWPAEEKIYQNQSDLSEPALIRYAGELGLDKTSFSQCLSSHAMEPLIRRDMADGAALAVNGTPTFFVDQQKFTRPIDPAEFSQLLDHALNSAASGTPSGGLPGGLLLSSGTNIFSNLQDSAMTCSNDEAKRQQPDLIRTPEARQLFEGAAKPLWVDVRAAKEFAGGHIPSAVNVPVDEFERRWNTLPRDRTIVLYESGRSAGDICGASRAAGRVLLAHGFPHEQVKVFQDGLDAWQKSGLPVGR